MIKERDPEKNADPERNLALLRLTIDAAVENSISLLQSEDISTNIADMKNSPPEKSQNLNLIKYDINKTMTTVVIVKFNIDSLPD